MQLFGRAASGCPWRVRLTALPRLVPRRPTRPPGECRVQLVDERLCLEAREIADGTREILTRLPDMRQAGEAQRLRSTLISGIKHMPVTYTPE